MQINTWPTLNFGDCLNDWVWPHYIPQWQTILPDYMLCGIGSLLNHRLKQEVPKIIMGCGYGHGEFPRIDRTFLFMWVRGPRTAREIHQRTGLEVPFIADPALLLSDMLQGETRKRWSLSYIPHCSANMLPECWQFLQEVCDAAGVHLIDVHSDRSQVITEIRESEKVATEALHGAIVADAFRIPWLPLTRRGVFGFKWHDWCESMQLRYLPKRTPYRASWFSPLELRQPLQAVGRRVARSIARTRFRNMLDRLRSSSDYALSPDGVVEERVSAMKTVISAFSESAARSPSALGTSVGVIMGAEAVCA